MRCVRCGTPVTTDTAHQYHEPGCGWFLVEQCVCERQVCARCCPDDDCVTPLQAQCRAAHDEQVAAPDAPEAAA